MLWMPLSIAATATILVAEPPVESREITLQCGSAWTEVVLYNPVTRRAYYGALRPHRSTVTGDAHHIVFETDPTGGVMRVDLDTLAYSTMRKEYGGGEPADRITGTGTCKTLP